VSDLTKSENAGEVAAGSSRLLEVYFGAKTSDGQRVLVETYYPYSLVEDRAAELRSRFTPLSIAALALLALAQVPLAIMLGRRLTRSRRERERLLERVISASDAERRRIAAEVHDGAVQDLIGISFSLEATADAAPAPIDESLHQLAGSTRTTVRRLRSLLSSIYPVEVPETGWASGLEDLVDALEESGVRVEQQIDPVRLTPFDELLLLRVARESLRNVDAHASAENVTVRLYERLGRVVLEVRDDGRGFSDANEVSSRREGHLGLQLLRDLATDVGATLDVDSDSGRGTTLRLELVGPR
jgi:signal transduction histidine kinase